MTGRRIRAILFDKDGTLVDFEKTWVAVGEALALSAAGGDRAEADRLLEIAGYDFASGTYKADSVFAAGTNAEIVQLWYPQFSEDEREERTLAFNAFTAVEGAAKAVALPGLEETVRELFDRGILLGVVTNDSGEGARLTLQALGIADRFLAAYGYDTVPRPKPSPDPVLAFSALSGVAPDEILVIGDNRHDLEMARAAKAGLAVGVLSGTGTQESLSPLADVVLGSIAELPDFLAARH